MRAWASASCGPIVLAAACLPSAAKVENFAETGSDSTSSTFETTLGPTTADLQGATESTSSGGESTGTGSTTFVDPESGVLSDGSEETTATGEVLDTTSATEDSAALDSESSGTAPVCGDGIVDRPLGEDCDDGEATARCDSDCTFAVCGDDTHNAAAGEACDDGEASAACDADCTLPSCGDGYTNGAAGEACDAGVLTEHCDSDCTLPECGDGFVNALAGETCDEGTATADCDADCTAVECGDGAQNEAAGETCDDGNRNDGDLCNARCGQPCVEVNGLTWCHAPGLCGAGCRAVCETVGRAPLDDFDAWFSAQDSYDECEAIADAFGIEDVEVGRYTFACAEDGPGAHSESEFTGTLYCSTSSECPRQHLEEADGEGIACDSDESWVSLCPCR